MRRILSLTSDGPDQTAFIGESLARALLPGDTLALDGDLGAGKTHLTRAVAAGLGLDPRQVSSPTFVIVAFADRTALGTLAPVGLVHADAYRLTGPEDLDSVGWDAAMAPVCAGEAVACVEWAARILGQHRPGEPPDTPARASSPLGPPDRLGRVFIELAAAGGRADSLNARRITLDVPRAWTLRPGWRAVAGLANADAVAKPGACPVCGRPVPQGCPTAPFDSPRCRGADLGRWLTGAYTLSRDARETDEG